MEEIWKDIAGYEGLYQVSNIGRIKSLPKKTYNPHCSHSLTKTKILKASKNNYGYITTHFRKKTIKVHRLVALAFIPNPNNKPKVNHKNGIKTDNRVENLEWCTQLENVIHGYETGLTVVPRGEKAYHAKLTNKQVLEIKELTANTSILLKSIAQTYGVTPSLIGMIRSGKRPRPPKP